MAGPSQPLDLPGSLAELQAILDVVCGIPGSISSDVRGTFYFPNVGANGETLPDGSTNTNTLAKLDYQIVSTIGLGTDELRTVYDEGIEIPGDTYEPDPLDPLARLGGVVYSVHGNRQVRVQIKAETFAPAGGGAFAYVERVRTRLMLPTIGDRLEAVGFAVAELNDSRPADYSENGRIVSVAWFEITFNAADIASDDPVTTIETVDGFSGVPIPPPVLESLTDGGVPLTDGGIELTG